MCTVVFSDGTACERAWKYRLKFGGICDACNRWSRKNGGATPHGRPAPNLTANKGASCSLCDEPATRKGMCRSHYRRTVYQHRFTDRDRSPERNAFYVVASADTVKFGVSSDVQRRVREHARTGLTQSLRVITDMPPNAAGWLEGHVKTVLAEEGARPVEGHEYFPAEWSWLITSVVDRLS
jgi:hypothetical protein